MACLKYCLTYVIDYDRLMLQAYDSCLLLTTIQMPPLTGRSFEYISEILDPQNSGKFLEELIFLKTSSASLSWTVIKQRSRIANTHEIRFCFITNDLQLTDRMTKKSSKYMYYFKRNIWNNLERGDTWKEKCIRSTKKRLQLLLDMCCRSNTKQQTYTYMPFIRKNNSQRRFFIIVPFILIYVEFTHQRMQFY